MANNTEIFRPIFSYKRQKFLDKINDSINNPNLRYARNKYLFGIDNRRKNKKLPMDCIENILSFIHKNL